MGRNPLFLFLVSCVDGELGEVDAYREWSWGQSDTVEDEGEIARRLVSFGRTKDVLNR